MRRLLKRRLTWFLILLAVLLGSYFVHDLARTKITFANYLKIRVGMTLAEVEQILGGPPRMESPEDIEPDYFTREGHFWPASTMFTVDHATCAWASRELVVWVDFDKKEGKVIHIFLIYHRVEVLE